MVEVVVKTLWQGKAGVRDRYVQEAKKTGQALAIFHNRECMVVPLDELDARIVGRSDMQFRDRYRKYKPGFLVYFDWKPDVIQVKLEI